MSRTSEDNKKPKLKLIFFGSSRSFISVFLLNSLIKTLDKSKDVSIIAVVDALIQDKPDKLYYKERYIALLKYFLKILFNSRNRVQFPYHGNFHKVASKAVSSEFILFPPEGNINHASFIHELKIFDPDVAISVACPQKFSIELLNIFTKSVNYHDSLLPKYRGTHSTAFSLYYGEKTTGYTFHYMDENFDSGNIIAQGHIPVDYNRVKDQGSVIKIQINKTFEASKHWDKVLDCLLRNEKGVRQEGESNYFGSRKLNQILDVKKNIPIDTKDLYKRLAIFGFVKVTFEDELVCATDVRLSNGYLKVKRINYLPVWIWALLKSLNIRRN